MTAPSSSLLSSLALAVAHWEREDADLLRQELATNRRRQAAAESALTEIRALINGERRPKLTIEYEWTMRVPMGRSAPFDLSGARPDLQADPPYADGAHAEPLDPDAGEGMVMGVDHGAGPDQMVSVMVDRSTGRIISEAIDRGASAEAQASDASQPPPSAPPAQPLPPTRRLPPPPAAPIQDPPRPIHAEAREGDIPDPGPTVADRRPVLLACSTIEEAESCRRWPRWEAHEGTLEPELRRLVGLLQEVEAAERAGDAGVLRDIRSRKLLASRPGVAARCQAALNRLLEPPSPSSPPSAPSAAPEPVAVVSEAVEAVAPTVPAAPPKPVDLGACSWDSPV